MVVMEAISHDVPMASTRPIAPYDEEDGTLAVRMPAEMDWDAVSDRGLRHALAIEDLCGLVRLTRVKMEEAVTTRA